MYPQDFEINKGALFILENAPLFLRKKVRSRRHAPQVGDASGMLPTSLHSVQITFCLFVFVCFQFILSGLVRISSY